MQPIGRRVGWRSRAAVLVALTMTSCAHLPQPTAPLTPAPQLRALDPSECRSLLRDDASPDSLRQATARSLDALRKLPPERQLTALDRRFSVGELTSLLSAVNETIDGTDWPQRLCERVRVYRAQPLDHLLVTGYYQPELRASRTRTERFRYPLYRTPEDLVDVDLGQYCAACSGRVGQGRVEDGKLVPYYSRAEIDAGVLAGRDGELAWLDDPVEAFFLHVQGSAVLRFDDGVHMQVSYASSNGRPYTSLGRVLIDQGKMGREAVTLQSLKDYLRAHPDEQAALMAANQRYIFFRTVVAGPIGSLGVPLTPGRSIAADAAVYPAGALVFLHIAPDATSSAAGGRPNISRFALIQDAGAAITGAGRIDVYWGSGETAESIAGEMRDPGELYLLLPP